MPAQVVDRTILVLQNVVLLVFLAVLLCEWHLRLPVAHMLGCVQLLLLAPVLLLCCGLLAGASCCWCVLAVLRRMAANPPAP